MTSSASATQAPIWVVEHMRARGLPERGRGVVTTHRRNRATARWCASCGEPIWTGPCDRFDVTLDPTPTTVEGELFALLDGRRTYELDLHLEIARRRPAHIETYNADRVRVYIAHKCGGPYAIPNERHKPPAKTDGDIPPF
jgi:hypothetical protein